MAALVTIHNDGPDAVEVRIGKQSILLYAGRDHRVATSHAVEVCNLPKISQFEMDLHMGRRTGSEDSGKNRYAED